MAWVKVQLRQVLRSLARAPLFTAVALLTLAVGIGSNTAIFSVVNGILLKPLPYPHPEQLVAVWLSAPGINIKDLNLGLSDYLIFREQNRTFQDIGLYMGYTVNIKGSGEPEQASGLLVTDGLLPVLGATPVLGRSFTQADDQQGSPDTVMLTYGYWQRKFGSDRSVVGRVITVDGVPHQILGVLRQDFRFGGPNLALLFPVKFDRGKTFLLPFNYDAVARLRPGVTLAEANTDVARMLPIVLRSFPPPPGYSLKMFEDARMGPNLRTLKQHVVGDVGKLLWVLMGGIGFVLLIACANVANLLLVRAQGRQQELAIRAALGATPGRVAAELLFENLVLALLGGVFGLALAYAALRVLIAIAPSSLPRLQEIGIDGRTLLFSLAASLVASIMFGSVSVLKYAGKHVGTGLRQGGRSMSEGRERHRSRSVLVVVQVALAVVLLISSGLMIRTFHALTTVDPGFAAPEQLQTFRVNIPDSDAKDPERVVRMQEEILRKIEAVPGVSSVGLSMSIPMDGNGWEDTVFVSDRKYSAGEIPLHRFRFVAPGFFKTLGTPLVAGRDFTWGDIYNKVPLAIISEKLARENWHDPSLALGKQIRANEKDDWREVVGVVRDVHDDGLDKEAPSSVYWPILAARFTGTSAIWGLLNTQPACRFRKFHERDSAGRVVGGSKSSPGRCPHARLLLPNVDGADFVHPGDACDRRRHGTVTRHRRSLRSDCVFRVAAKTRDWHPQRCGRAATGTDGNVRAPRFAADGWGSDLRARCSIGADTSDVLATIWHQTQRPGNLCSGVDSSSFGGRGFELFARTSRLRGEPS
jgi:predicted permease